ncbi:hypothetical protein KXD93_12155 [Mucilaginibacter sp. BJC16-A38]|uniref:hypothetical protein n=1 Tax=Mucilaginibacter phenanthrenivorans TaxID=1234842 RepID=UPI0021581681|nr:hypothetical protein [Mucilaginibacter phenanthrenivorans]MCR8558403.1 hypothetical protein [Mucilaginibacter phenanthrenivorans]
MNYSTKPFIKASFFSILLIFSAISFGYAQTDTVVLNNQRIACSVKEVTPDAVKYSFPGEDVINSVYKNTVQKIIFKSGRVQTFAESTSYKSISGVMDYDKVTITAVESEVRGLFKLSDVSAKAKGTTVYSNQERVKDRAYRKIKIQAAMFGANIIYLSNQRTEGNKYGTYFTAGSTAETNLTGVAYSNILPDFEKFKKTIGTKNNFNATIKYELGGSDSDVSQDNINKPFTITNITNDNGIVFIEGDLKGERDVHSFQLVNFGDNSFSIAYKYKGTAYNLVINI